MERVFDVLGMSIKNIQEYTPQNIRDFNLVANDAQDVEYFSVGAQKPYFHVANVLKHSHDIISEGMEHNRNDGVVRPEESQWGDYLLTFE